MSVFGIGGWELLLILVIMLVVAGPDRMVKWAYTLGQYTAKMRHMWEETMAVVQREVNQAGIDVELPKTPPTRQSIRRAADDLVKKTVDPDGDLKRFKGELDATTGDIRSLTNDKPAPPNKKTPTPEQPPTDTTTDSAPQASNYGTWGGGES